MKTFRSFLTKLLICAMLIGFCLPVPTSFAANYDASAAIEYARTWSGAEKQADCPHGTEYTWCHCGYNNSQYYAYTRSNKYSGNVDCANFVSQCLHAGGLPMDSTWKVNSNKMGTAAWVNVTALVSYLEGLGYKGTKHVSIDNIQPGDVVCTGYNGTGDGSHVLIVSKVENGRVYCCAHTKNNKDVAYAPTALVYHVAMQGSNPETNPPVIESITLTNQSAAGYRVVATITDESAIEKVQFPTWRNTAQDATIKWLDGMRGEGNTWYADVMFSNHGGETNCTYITHVYATDIWGNQKVKAKNVRVENVAPVISDVKVTAVTSDGFTVSATVTDSSELKTVYFPSWSTGTAVWFKGTHVGENVWSADVSFEKCGSLPTDKFYTHVYATDVWDNEAKFELNRYYLDLTGPTITDVQVSAITSEGFTVTAKVEDDSEIKSVYFPTWSTGTAVWFKGTYVGEKVWSADITFEKCGSQPADRFYTHVYATDAMGNETKFEKNRYYLDQTPPVIESIEIVNHSMSGYRVVATVTDENGIAKVQFPTWKNGAQAETEQWLDGVKGEDDTWYVDVVLADFGGEINCTYVTHVYAMDNFGNQEVKAKNVRVENVAPEFTNLAYELDGQKLCASIDISDRNVLTGVVCKVWNKYGSATVECTQMENGSYAAEVDLTQLTVSGTYYLQFAAMDFWGNGGVSETIVCAADTKEPTIESIVLADCHAYSLRFEMHVMDESGIASVQFAVRDADNSEVLWVEAVKKDGVWCAELDIDEAALTDATYLWYQGYAEDVCGNVAVAEPVTAAILWPVPETQLVLPAELKKIEDQAFMNDLTLESVMIQSENGVEIGSQAFAGCESLTAVVLGENVAIVADDAFEGCEAAIIYCAEESYAAMHDILNQMKIRFVEFDAQA